MEHQGSRGGQQARQVRGAPKAPQARKAPKGQQGRPEVLQVPLRCHRSTVSPLSM